MVLVNVITKKQFHVMLLKDIEYDLKKLPYIDEHELDYEIFPKPWGFYKSTLLAEFVQSKNNNCFSKRRIEFTKT